MNTGRLKWLLAVAVLLLVLIALVFAARPRERGAARPANGPIRIVTTTSLLQCAAREIGGNHVRVSVLIAPGSCPGHYDICPKDLTTLADSRLLLTHGYEGFVPKLMDSMGSDRPKEIAIKVNGNWMLPSVYVRALEKVADALSASDPAHARDYRGSLALGKAECMKLDAQLRRKLKTAGVTGTPVLCSDQQADVAKWMGLNVVDTYPRAEEFTPALLHYMTQIGGKRHARMCVDNLQSGPTAGAELARDIGAAHITLSSFPGGFAGTDTWAECIEDNANRVIGGLKSK